MGFGEPTENYDFTYEYRVRHRNGVELIISIDTFTSGVPETLRDEAFQGLIDYVHNWSDVNIPESVGGGKTARRAYVVSPTPPVEPEEQ